MKAIEVIVCTNREGDMKILKIKASEEEVAKVTTSQLRYTRKLGKGYKKRYRCIAISEEGEKRVLEIEYHTLTSTWYLVK